jgi:hypothetical protein
MTFDDFEVLRAIGRGAFGKVSIEKCVHKRFQILNIESCKRAVADVRTPLKYHFEFVHAVLPRKVGPKQIFAKKPKIKF